MKGEPIMKRKGTNIPLGTFRYVLALLSVTGTILVTGVGAQDRAPLNVENRFFATGWMGDGKDATRYIDLLEKCSEDPHSGPACIRITYKEFGREGWGGMYWQNQPDNWGDRPGEDLSQAGYNSITFWARGSQGDELVEFKAGDIIEGGKKYKDSFRATAGKVFLTKDWQKFYVDLQGKDLSCVIGGFCWIAAQTGNDRAPTFYIDDINYAYEIPPKLDYFDIGSRFTASGWMGDGEFGTAYIRLQEACKEKPRSGPACVKVTYATFGPKTWGGIYWQNRTGNWGDYAGDDLSKAGYRYVTFWARGETGDEAVEFKAGGIIAPGKTHADSFEVSLGRVSLTREWRQYRMDLTGKDLSSVIGGFCWVANRPSNPDGLTFYLDDIRFER
jgi:hypothetical protein